MAEANTPRWDSLDPLSPGLVMEFDVDKPLPREEQLLLQQRLRTELDSLLRSVLQSLPESRLAIPNELLLVEVTIQDGSIRAVVRFTRTAVVGLLLGIAGCSSQRPPSYAETVSNSLGKVYDTVQRDVQAAADSPIASSKTPEIRYGVIAEIEQTLVSVSVQRLSADAGESRLAQLFKQIDESSDRPALISAFTLYVKARYGDEFFMVLKQRLSKLSGASLSPSDQIRQATSGLEIVVVVKIKNSKTSTKATPELIRQVVREELEVNAKLAGEEWIPVVGPIRQGRYGKAAWDVVLLIALIESILQHVDRWKRRLERVKAFVKPAVEQRLTNAGIKADVEVRPNDQVATTIVNAVEQVRTNGGSEDDVVSVLMEVAKKTKSNKDRRDLESQAAALSSTWIG